MEQASQSASSRGSPDGAAPAGSVGVPPTEPRASPSLRICWPAWLAVLGIVIIHSLRHLADHWWIAACGTAWSLHAGLLLCMATLFRVRRAPIAVAVAALLCGVLAYDRWAAIPRLEGGSGSGDLRLTVANQGYWNEDPGVAAALLANDPHLLLVIETSLATERALEATRSWSGTYTTFQKRHAFGWACYAAWPLRPEAIPGREPGMAMLLHVERPGAPFRVIVMHPPPPIGSEAHAAHRRILDAIGALLSTSEVPTLVLGDANATAEVPALRRLAAAGMRRASPALGSSWPSALGPAGMGIDHILVKEGSWRLVDAGTVRIPGSDHRGRTATLLTEP